jgi:hypothetical protein
VRPAIALVATLLWPVSWALFGAGLALVVSGPRVPHVGVWSQVILCAGATGITGIAVTIQLGNRA